MTPIRVLIFTNSFLVGGSERQAVELARSLNRTKFDVMLACFQKNGHLLGELPSDLPCPDVYPLKGFLSASCVHQSVRFLRFLRGIRPHVVQCFDFYSNVFAIPIARFAGVPVIVGARRNGVLKTPGQLLVQRWCYRLASGVVANAGAIKEILVNDEGLQPRRVWVIHNGVDLSRFDSSQRPSSADSGRSWCDLRIGVVANLRPEKGHLVFLHAAQHLAGLYPSARFIIAGDGPMKGLIASRIRELSLSKRVQLLGFVRDIPSFLRNLDIVVLPSSSEAFPNAVQEAMAASLPVVATDTGGTRELVIDGETGFLVSPNDSSALADCIGRLCSDREMCLKMGEAGRRRVAEQFTADRMARRFEDLYLELLTRRKTREIVTGANADSPLTNPTEDRPAQN